MKISDVAKNAINKTNTWGDNKITPPSIDNMRAEMLHHLKNGLLPFIPYGKMYFLKSRNIDIRIKDRKIVHVHINFVEDIYIKNELNKYFDTFNMENSRICFNFDNIKNFKF